MKRFFALICAVFIFQTAFAREPLVIGIAGGTGSGKTTLATKIQEAFQGQAVLMSQDSYYKDLSHLSLEERRGKNFDHPDSIDFELLLAQLKELKQGHVIEKPVYNFHTYIRENATETVTPNEIIIVEGILLFVLPELCDYCDLKLFVDADDDVRLLRRIERDLTERSRTFDSVKGQYLSTVKPMHDAFVFPSKKQADIIIPFGGENRRALEMIVSKLKDEISNR